MEEPRKVEVPLPPQERHWGCLQWAGVGCGVIILLVVFAAYVGYKRYVSPVVSDLNMVLSEAESVRKLSDAEILSRVDSTVTLDQLEDNPSAYRGKFVRLRALVQSEKTSKWTIKGRTFRLFQIGEGSYVLADRFAEDVAYGDFVEIIGLVSEVDVNQAIEKMIPGVGADLLLDQIVVLIARRVRILAEKGVKAEQAKLFEGIG
jgi:hypothetical protein